MKVLFTMTVLAISFFYLLSTYAPGGVAPVADVGNSDDGIAGFWIGLLHGVFIFVYFPLSLVFDGVAIYEVNNSGSLYDIGFFSGIVYIGIAFSGVFFSVYES